MDRRVYLFKGGKNHGPYTLEEVRQHIRNRSFTEKDYACHDGKNWIRVSELPGFARIEKAKPAARRTKSSAKKRKSKKRVNPVKKRNRTKIFLTVGVPLILLILGLIGGSIYLLFLMSSI